MSTLAPLSKQQKLKLRFEQLKIQKNRRLQNRLLRVFAVVTLVVFSLLARCACQKEHKQSLNIDPTPFQTVFPPNSPKKVQIASPKTSADPRPRPMLPVPAQTEPLWTQLLRTQVSARSTSLSACFPTSSKSAVRWTARLQGLSGLTSQHTFEEMDGSSPLTDGQRTCLIKIYGETPYKMQGFESLDARFSLILAF